ncbi:MAG: ATP-binding protein [Anaerolineae bacterium]
MSLLARRDTLNSGAATVRRVSWKDVTKEQSGANLLRVAGLFLSIGLIAMLVYYAEVRGVFLRHLYRYLFIFPIALGAYNFGTSGGLSAALSCTAVLFPLFIQFTRRYGLSGETLEVLSIVVVFNLFAFIVANLADFQRKQERLQLILAQIGGLFEKGLDTEELSAAILKSGMEICHAEFGEIVLQDDVTGELQTAAEQGAVSANWGFYGTFTSRGTCLAEWLVANNEAVLVNHLDRDPRFERRPGTPIIRSLLAVPLQHGSGAFGFLALMNKQGGLFTSEDLETLTAIVEKSQMAIENARLYEQTDEKLRRRVEEFARLAQLSMALSATLDLDQSLEAAAEHAARALEAPICEIHLVDGDYLSACAAVGCRNGEADRPLIKIEGRVQRMTQELQPLVVADLEREPALPAMWHRWSLKERVRAYLGVPLASQGSGIGLLSIYRKEPHEWSAHEVDFATTIANTVASAIANAQLFETISKAKRRAELVLRTVAEAKHWRDLVLSGIADGVMTTDEEDRIQMFNAAAERITGWSAEEAIGRSCREIFGAQDENDRQSGDDMRSHRQTPGETAEDLQTYKTSFTRPDGAELTLAITMAPLCGQLGEPIGTVSVFRDISKEEHLDRMKSDFVSMVSHELRAPLTNILASVDLLRRNRLNPQDEQEVVDILYSQSRRLNRFVEDILRASRIDSGQIQVQLQPVTVCPLLRRTIDAVQVKGVCHKFEVVIQPGLPYVSADESKLEIILHNLLSNAIHYSSSGSTITVEAREDNGNVVISISDEGVGISPLHQNYIFEPFYRTNTGNSRWVDGYGLGLYICKRLVEAQGGRIWVESQEGVGSRFSLSLQLFQN